MINQTATIYKVRSDDAVFSGSHWGPSPEIAYQLYLKAVIFPNITLTANNSFAFANGVFRTYSGDIVAALIF
jgi:hypothetical protein